MIEFDQKFKRMQALLAEHNLNALLLRRASSFAWATGGAASYVNTATTNGEAALLITPAGRYLITNNIEATRLEKEEKLVAQGWGLHVVPWYEVQDAVTRMTAGFRLGADGPYPGATDLSAGLARLRTNLGPDEIIRLRALGHLCAEAMDQAIRAIEPGQTEYRIAGKLAYEVERRGAQAIVNLIATDDRVSNFRHPLPTGKKLDRYAMLVLCGRRRGLVCSITRLVHFGPIPEELRRKAEAVAQVDATFITATCPGSTLGSIFEDAVATYARVGYADEWKLHHQGGPAGYEPREYVATPGSAELVAVGQAYAWNPSITGAKSEDTMLVGEANNEILTTISGWPMLPIAVEGQPEPVMRPAILEIL
jgi:antitoxin VapB